jgi:hypothetical protein
MTLSVPDDVITQPVGDEIVLLKFGTGQYYGLDGVGTRMWQLLVEHGEKTQVIDLLLEEYETDRPALTRDLDDLVDRLLAQGLLAHAPAR